MSVIYGKVSGKLLMDGYVKQLCVPVKKQRDLAGTDITFLWMHIEMALNIMIFTFFQGCI